jgi:uncharacterized phage protein gp47/JayE
MKSNGQPHIDYTNKDYDSLRQAMLELAREKLPEWTDHSSNDLGVVLLELFAYMGDILLYYQDRLANESYLDTAVERRSVMNLLRLIGYELRPPQPASADLSLLFKADASGIVVIPKGAEFQTTAQATGQPVNFQYVLEPLSVNLAGLPLTTHQGEAYRLFDTLPVIQVDAAVSREIAGSSDGRAGQRLALARAPLIANSLVVWVDEGSGPQAWQQRDTLLYSLSNDRHYGVRRDENDLAWLEFGDGQYGQIPRRGHNNITASYRVGGGPKGNVPPLTITKAVSQIEALQGVFNRRPAGGGADHEPITEAVQRGPQLFRARSRAVTAADYEAYAKEFGVGKVRARAGSWNRVDLYVAPAGGGYPSETLKADLRTYFEDKRPVTVFVEVRNPVYVAVFIEGELEVEPYFITRQVQQQAEKAVRDLLAFEQVNFGQKLYLSKIYETIEKIEGVAGVYIKRFARANPAGELPSDGILTFDWAEIPQIGAGGLTLTVRGGRYAD